MSDESCTSCETLNGEISRVIRIYLTGINSRANSMLLCDQSCILTKCLPEPYVLSFVLIFIIGHNINLQVPAVSVAEGRVSFRVEKYYTSLLSGKTCGLKSLPIIWSPRKSLHTDSK